MLNTFLNYSFALVIITRNETASLSLPSKLDYVLQKFV